MVLFILFHFYPKNAVCLLLFFLCCCIHCCNFLGTYLKTKPLAGVSIIGASGYIIIYELQSEYFVAANAIMVIVVALF